MQLKLKTETLKSLTSKVVKGMGNHKMLPITEMVGINVENDFISLLSTDGTNSVEVKGKIENTDNESFSISVNGNTFIKLVQKITTEFITLVVNEDSITIKGNGSYSFPIPVDEDNNKVVFKPLTLDGVKQEVEVASLKDSYSLNKESVANTMEVPAYTGFYYDENGSVTTNSIKISYLSKGIIKNPVLLFTSFVQLFSILDDKTATIVQNNSEICIFTNSVVIKSLKMTDITEFPINEIKPFITTEMPHKVKVNKQALLNLLNRIEIFVTPYDKNGIKVDFTKEGMKVWTIKGDSYELLPYIDSTNQENASIKIDVTNFKALISACPEEEVTIHYGNPNAIKMTFGDVIQVIALQSEN